MRNLLCAVGLFFVGLPASWAQDTLFARQIIEELASPAMEGRGFAHRADLKAADYLVSVMKEIAIEPLHEVFFHRYSFSANTFPAAIGLKINGRTLKPQTDYFYSLSSPATKRTFRIERLFDDTLKTRPGLNALRKRDLSDKVIITDWNPDRLADSLAMNVGAIFFQADSGTQMVWRNSDAAVVKPYVSAKLAYKVVQPGDSLVECIIETEFINKGEAVNVAGVVRGSRYPDRYLMVTAHYDHLGLMGKGNRYPGANDNASGVAMMLDLARHFAQKAHKPEISILFVAFSGEESGLWGSKAFAAHMPVAADSVALVLNLDMVGTGSGGITVVNGEANPTLYSRMAKLNADNEYVATVKKRGSSCNSDHCPFDRMGIPAIFIYSMGREWPYYHVPEDKAPIPLTEYEDIFRLLRDFLIESSRTLTIRPQ